MIMWGRALSDTDSFMVTTDRGPFYGKVMLFGEYSVILGSKALVVPLKCFSGQWSRKAIVHPRQNYLRDELIKYCEYLSGNAETASLLRTDAMHEALEQGWWLDTDIPVGYGVGSSGLVVAALYESFAVKRPDELMHLKRQLGLLENYFHGNSSGIDPLCCLLRQPVLIDGQQQLSLPGTFHAPEGWKVFLFDSGRSGLTGPLVQYFQQRMQEYSFYRKVKNDWIPAVNGVIEQFLAGDSALLSSHLVKLSHFERHQLGAMIPPELEAFWDTGLSDGRFLMKLCGSGGGGFSLVFTEDETAMRQHLPAERLIPFGDSL